MPVKRRVDKARHRDLGAVEIIELRAGPHASGSAFPSDEDRAGAWAVHRDALLAWSDKLHAGQHRPWAWWRYERGRDDAPAWADEPAELSRLGLPQKEATR
jgi:hypothetical protein